MEAGVGFVGLKHAHVDVGNCYVVMCADLDVFGSEDVLVPTLSETVRAMFTSRDVEVHLRHVCTSGECSS